MQRATSKAPFRVRRLPWPRTPLRERRAERSNDPSTALKLALSRAADRGFLDVVLIADDLGMLVANSRTDLDLNMVAAVAPIVGRGKAMASIRRNGVLCEITVRPMEVENEILYIAALGGQHGARMREVASSVAATRRILA